MKRLFSIVFFFIFSIFCGAQPLVFQGRVDLGRDLSSFEANPPIPGTLYLMTGAAAKIRVVSQKPFVAEVEFVQAEWKDETDLLAHRVLLRFEGPDWAEKVVAKKPRQGAESIIYPYRKFQVAAVPMAGGFRAMSVPILF